jgi:hypothetical protein
MKTIFRIIVILLVAAVVAGGCILAVNHTSVAGNNSGAEGQPPAALNTGRQTTTGLQNGQFPSRPDGAGDTHGASLGRGLSGVLVMLAEIGGVVLAISLIQKGLGQMRRTLR